MRFKLTLFLLVANIFLAGAIWLLERKPELKPNFANEFVEFTELEISGKNIEKPRVLKLENNRWRIVSPINWAANFYAVSHIRNQLEFLNKETSFSVDEIQKHGQTLADFGLDDPIYVFKYGNGKDIKELKIGKLAAVGNRIYMLDSESNKIVVADKSFVENLSSNIDTLRSQNIFDIPQFEVSAFSVRLSDGSNLSSGAKPNFRRIGLIREGRTWSLETPINAPADYTEVDAFLKSIVSLNARSFVSNAQDTGLDVSSFPTSITIQGTNRSQTLLLGKLSNDGVLQYARLEENPTVFLIDSRQIRDLKSLQTELRSKSFFQFDENDLSEIDISNASSSVKLKKLNNGVWDAMGAVSRGENLISTNADFAVVSSIIAKLSAVRARAFVTDSLGDDLSLYGLENPTLKVSIKTSAVSKTLLLGKTYTLDNSKYTYAAIQGEKSVYAISSELLKNLPCNILGCKSRVLDSIPASAKLREVKLLSVSSKKSFLDLDLEKLQDALKNLGEREKNAVLTLEKYAKSFRVASYLTAEVLESELKIDGKSYPFEFEFVANLAQTGTGGVKNTQKSLRLTKRISGTIQYGVSSDSKTVFILTQEMIDAISALTVEKNAPLIFSTPAPAPVEPKK